MGLGGGGCGRIGVGVGWDNCLFYLLCLLFGWLFVCSLV